MIIMHYHMMLIFQKNADTSGGGGLKMRKHADKEGWAKICGPPLWMAPKQ